MHFTKPLYGCVCLLHRCDMPTAQTSDVTASCDWDIFPSCKCICTFPAEVRITVHHMVIVQFQLCDDM